MTEFMESTWREKIGHYIVLGAEVVLIIQWNPDFSTTFGKSKLVQIIRGWGGGGGGLKRFCSNQWQRLGTTGWVLLEYTWPCSCTEDSLKFILM